MRARPGCRAELGRGKRDVDGRNLVSPELEIADAVPVVGGCIVPIVMASGDLSNDNFCLALGEHSCLRRSSTCHVTDRVDVVVSGSQGVRVDRDPTVFAQPRLLDHRWHVMPGDTEEEIGIELGAVVQARDSSTRIDVGDQVLWNPPNVTLGEGAE